jgi:hypothetical protein
MPNDIGAETRSRPRGSDCSCATAASALLDALDGAVARLEERRPRLGEREPASGAMQEPRAQALLQARDVLAHHRARDAQVVGGRW